MRQEEMMEVYTAASELRMITKMGAEAIINPQGHVLVVRADELIKEIINIVRPYVIDDKDMAQVTYLDTKRTVVSPRR